LVHGAVSLGRKVLLEAVCGILETDSLVSGEFTAQEIKRLTEDNPRRFLGL